MNQESSDAATYVRYHLALGIPEMTIREHFLRHGWSIEQTNQLFQETLTVVPAASKKDRIVQSLKEVIAVIRS